MNWLVRLLFGEEREESQSLRTCAMCDSVIKSHVAREKDKNNRYIYFCKWECYMIYHV